ncbi:hypothetical protein Tco_1549138 [Tanacetum coccineum]
MATLKFADTHNMVAFLSKPTESDGFEQIFWSTAMAKTINEEAQLHALVDGKAIIITESSVRRDLQLADEGGVDYLPNSTIFEQLALMGLMRAATTASSLEAEQDSGNINKTQSKATPNESSSLGANSGDGPGCQETMGDTIAQTRFESVSKQSNDSLLARGNTLQSDEDSLKLKELMELCTNLQNRVLDLEKTKPLNKMRLLNPPDNEESLGEDASKHGRIDAIDADEETTLVISAAGDIVSTASIPVSTASAATIVNVATTTTVTKPKVKGVVIQELGESTTTISSQQSQDKGKGILIEPVKRKDQMRLDEEAALKLQAEFDEQERLAREKAKKVEENMEGYKLKDLKLKEFDSIQEMFDRAFKRVNTFKDFRTKCRQAKEKRAGTELIQEDYKKQKIMRADKKSQMYMVFSQMLKSFDREDLEDLYKLVKAKYGSTKQVEDLDLLLWGDLKTMFEPHVEDQIYMPTEVTDDSKWAKMDGNDIENLHLALEDGVLSSIEEKKTAKEIWDHLARLYEARSLHNKIFLKRKLYALRMMESTSMTAVMEEENRCNNRENRHANSR